MASNQGKSKYCAAITEGLQISTWLRGDQAKCLMTVKKSIKIFRDHLQPGICGCVVKGSNLVILSVAHYHLFFLSLEAYSKQLEEEEKRYATEDNMDDGCGDSNHVNHDNYDLSESQLPSFEASKPSLYGNLLLPQYVNAKMQQNLLKPLKESIRYLRKALTDEAKTIPSKLLIQLKLNTLLLTAHNIFNCYIVPDYRYHTADLLIKLSSKLLPEEKESLLIGYHMLIRLYLDYNVVSHASQVLKRARETLNSMRLKGFEHTQAALIYLDECEIDLRNGEYDKSSGKLKKLIQSNYLARLTLNRFHLKGLALLLASKFPPSYQHSSDYNGFIEPLHITMTILKRWHRKLLTLPPKESEKGADSVEDDHPWFRYEIYSFSFEALNLIKTFYLNVGFPFELSPLYNCLLTLSRQNCFLLWSVQLMKLGSSIDLKCDKTKPALSKIQLGLAALTFVSSSAANLTGSDEHKLSSPSKLDSNLIRAYKDIEIEITEADDLHLSELPKSSGADRCIHDIGYISAWEIEKVLRKGDLKEDDEFPIDGSTLIKMLDSRGSKLQFPHNLHFIELVIYMCYAKKKFDKDLVERIQKEISQFSSSVQPMYHDLIKHLHIKPDELIAPAIPEVLLMNLNLTDMLADHYLEKRDFSSIIKLCSSFLPQITISCISFTAQDYIGRILFKFIRARNAMLNLKPSFPEFDAKEIHEKMVRPVLACKTPSPVRSNFKPTKVNAPRREVGYKMEELRDYAKSLHDPPKKQAPRRSARNSARKSSVSSDKMSSTDSDVVILTENIKIPVSTRKSRTTARCKASDISSVSSGDKIKQTDPLISSKSLSSIPVSKESAKIDLLTDAIDCITIADDADDNEDVFVSQQNLITEIVKGSSSITTNINSLKNLAIFYSNHPPIDIYPELHHQLFQLYSADCESNAAAASYHLHESPNAAMVRYRALFARENKKRIKVQMELSLDNLVFNPIDDINFQSLSKITPIIPESWRIVQIFSYLNNKAGTNIPDLLISRWQKNKKTVIIRIKGNPDKFTRNFMDEFYEIIQLSNASIRKQDSQTFWSARTALDQRLNMLLQSVTDAWLGPFKSLLMGFTNDPKLTEFRAEVKKSICTCFDLKFCQDEDLLDSVIEAFPILTAQQFETAICFLFSQFSFAILEECYHNCLEIYEKFYSEDEQKDLLKKIEFAPVGLIVSKSLEGFPFESLSSAVAGNQQFFRIPSLRFLTSLLKTHSKDNKLYNGGINYQNTYYLLNPTNNLMKTEKRFKDKFLRQVLWKGCISKPPEWQGLKEGLNKSDLYIFFGHGAGSRYYKSVPDGIDSLNTRAAALIVGCCSAKLFVDGPMFDSFGMPYRFMINGCPTYLGLLWDVTDGDIDRFADRLLIHWLPNWAEKEMKESATNYTELKDLCKALIHARLACRFTCLTGAAPVVYGLPISVKVNNSIR